MTGPHMCLRRCPQASASAASHLFQLDGLPHTIVVYASPWSSPSTTRTLTTRRPAFPYLGRTCTGWNTPACLAHRHDTSIPPKMLRKWIGVLSLIFQLPSHQRSPDTDPVQRIGYTGPGCASQNMKSKESNRECKRQERTRVQGGVPPFRLLLKARLLITPNAVTPIARSTLFTNGHPCRYYCASGGEDELLRQVMTVGHCSPISVESHLGVLRGYVRSFYRVVLQDSSFAYCAGVKRGSIPPLPVSIACSSICLASDVPQASPRLASSLIFSGSVKVSFRGRGS